MPELAEIEYFRKQWNPGIGQGVQQTLTHQNARIFREVPASEVEALLPGHRLLESAAHGKKLCFRFSGDIWMGLHLGMSGKLLTAPAGTIPGKHEHLVLCMDSLSLVFSDYRMFGKVRLHQGAQPPEWWSQLPPQPQDPAFTKAHFNNILSKHKARALKALLLEQDAFPGIGNWMADEILWRARVHPQRCAAELTWYRRDRIYHALREVSADALRVIGSDWGTPPDSWLFNHRWQRGGSCPQSGKPLEWITVGGRTSCYSPAIQT